MLRTFNSEQEWLDARKGYITGTDMPQILGVSRFGGPTAVALSKLGEAQPFEVTEQMEWGRRLEEAILVGYAHKRQVPLNLADPHSLFVSDEHPILAASLDALADPENYPVDAKNVHHLDPSRWGDEGTDQIPDEYAVQLTVQMIVTGAKWADLAALFSGSNCRVYRLHRNEQVVNQIIETAEVFWQRHIIAGVLPPPDGTDAYSNHLAKKFRSHTELLVPANDDAIAWAEVLKLARADKKAIEVEEARAEQALKEIIGDNLGVKGPGFKVTWKKAADSKVCQIDNAVRGFIIRLCENPMSGGYSLPREKIEALWEEVLANFTTSKPGSRRFLPQFTEKE